MMKDALRSGLAPNVVNPLLPMREQKQKKMRCVFSREKLEIIKGNFQIKFSTQR